MGKVFTPNELVFGSPPTKEDFQDTVSAFSEAMLSEINNGTVHGSMIYGSAAIDKTTVRSDIDCLIVMTDLSHEKYASVRTALAEVHARRRGRVPISAILYEQAVLEGGRHEIDRFFGHHLTGPSRLIHGVDPATYMKFSQDPALSIFNAYIRNKKRRLSGAYASQDELENIVGIQRMLELPLAIGRKSIRVIDELEGSSFATSDSANKQKVQQLADTTFDQLGVKTAGDQIREFDQEYSELLLATIDRRKGLEDYQQGLGELHARIPIAIKWLDDVDIAMQDRLAT